MKNFYCLLFFLFSCSCACIAQTLTVHSGGVDWLVPAEEMGNAVAGADGETLTIMGKEFRVTDISSMDVGTETVSPYTVAVVYSGHAAGVTCSGDCMSHLSISVSGADVIIEQDDDLEDEITYTLTGSSTDGSFYMDGRLKATVELHDLTLASSSTAPINIRNGKRIAIVLDGTSTLTDAATSDGKGALMVNGHSEFSGDGTLNITGNARHAYWADEYIQLKKSFTGQINILHAAGDGINVNQYFRQNGGTVSIADVGDDGIQVSADDDETGYVLISGGTLSVSVSANGAKGIKADGTITIDDDKGTPDITVMSSAAAYYDSADREIKGTSCISSDTDISISAGVLTLTATGTGGKGVKADGVLDISGGVINVSTSGSRLTYGSDTSSPKGLRAGAKASTSNGAPTGELIISGGEINVSATGKNDGSEGIESKNTLTVSGGNITVRAYDDAVNSAKDMRIEGGTLAVISENNDGLDSNADLIIDGGTVYAYGGAQPECSLDAAERYGVYINGGTVLGVGGSAISIENGSAAHYATATASIAEKTAITLTDSGGKTLFETTVPEGYNSAASSMGGSNPGSSGGGMGGRMLFAPGGGTGGTGGIGGNNPGSSSNGYQILVSTPEIQANQQYTITSGATSVSATGK